MKRFLTTLSAVTLLVVASGASFAQYAGEITPPDKGTAEVSLGIQSQLLSPTTTALSLSYAPYMNRNLQVGGGVDYYHESGYTQWGVGVKVTYNFVAAEGPVARMIPYAGVGLSYLKSDMGDYYGSDSATAWNVFGGVKQFITPSVALYGQLQWSKSDKEIYRDGKKDELRLMVGLSTYLNMGKAE